MFPKSTNTLECYLEHGSRFTNFSTPRNPSMCPDMIQHVKETIYYMCNKLTPSQHIWAQPLLSSTGLYRPYAFKDENIDGSKYSEQFIRLIHTLTSQSTPKSGFLPTPPHLNTSLITTGWVPNIINTCNYRYLFWYQIRILMILHKYTFQWLLLGEPFCASKLHTYM